MKYRIILFILLSLTVINSAATIYVKPGGGGNMDGTSWANAYASLQAAITAAASGDQVWVAAGTYKPPQTDKMVHFSMKEGVAIYGGFDGVDDASRQKNNK